MDKKKKVFLMEWRSAHATREHNMLVVVVEGGGGGHSVVYVHTCTPPIQRGRLKREREKLLLET